MITTRTTCKLCSLMQTSCPHNNAADNSVRAGTVTTHCPASRNATRPRSVSVPAAHHLALPAYGTNPPVRSKQLCLHCRMIPQPNRPTQSAADKRGTCTCSHLCRTRGHSAYLLGIGCIGVARAAAPGVTLVITQQLHNTVATELHHAQVMYPHLHSCPATLLGPWS
jgi:hypothetical protein